MPRLDQCHVLVLAAGNGARMGGPKALMSVEGRAWWKVQNQRLGAIGIGVTWIVSQEVQRALEADTQRPANVILGAPGPMFASLLRGLRSLEASPPKAVFVLPVDSPAPCQSVWEALAAAGGVAVPEFEGNRGHPACLAWDWIESAVLTEAKTAVDSSALRLDTLMKPFITSVVVSDPGIAMNLNTPDDVHRYLASIPATPASARPKTP